MKIMNRRSFLGAMAATGMSAAAIASGCSPEPEEIAAPAEEEQQPVEEPQEPTPTTAEKNWQPTAKNTAVEPLIPDMPVVLDDATVDALVANPPVIEQDWQCADGSTVPAAFVAARNVINRNGLGFGGLILSDDQFALMQLLFTEEEATLYAKMPFYTTFTAAELAETSGESEEDCDRICNALADKAMLRRNWEDGVAYFNTQGSEYGYYEAYVQHFDKNYLDMKDMNQGVDLAAEFCNIETTMYRSLPVSLDVIIDGQYNEWVDWRGILQRATKIAISPCMCRSKQLIQSGQAENVQEILEKGITLDGHPMETCITTGKEAEYFIETGAGREISVEEATAIYEDAVEKGMIVESVYTKASESICLCHADCCLNVGAVRSLNGGAAMENYSEFNLYHAKDECIKCGACMNRCPMFAITMDEDGYPIVDGACVRCGQCATVCPQGVRGLLMKDNPHEIPEDMLEDYKAKARVRASKGFLIDATTPEAMAETIETMGPLVDALVEAMAAGGYE